MLLKLTTMTLKPRRQKLLWCVFAMLLAPPGLVRAILAPRTLRNECVT